MDVNQTINQTRSLAWNKELIVTQSQHVMPKKDLIISVTITRLPLKMTTKYLTASADLPRCLGASVSPPTDDSPPLSLTDRFL